MRAKEFESAQRIQCRKNGRLAHNLENARNRERREPEHDDGAKEFADRLGAAGLHCEQSDQDARGYRHDIGIERRRGNVQTFHRA